MAESVLDKLRRLVNLKPSAVVGRPAPIVPPEATSYPARGQDQRLSQLVALKMFELGFPLDHVRAQSASIDAAITALSADMLAEQSQPLPAMLPEGPSWEADTLFYDQVRRLATALHIPHDALTDYDQLARQHEWTRDTIGNQLAGHDD